MNDERWLIDDVCRVASAAGARWLVLENVVGILTANGGNAMARVCAAMAKAGFIRWEWKTFRASDIGACHRRERWFCVAENPHTQFGCSNRESTPRKKEIRGARADISRSSGASITNSGSLEWNQWSRHGEGAESRVWRNGFSNDCGKANTGFRNISKKGSDRQDLKLLHQSDKQSSLSAESECNSNEKKVNVFGQYQAAIDMWETIIKRHSPPPLKNKRLNPVFVEWMMGLPDGWVTDIIDTRSHALKILGNGVVPQQAAAAIHSLLTVET